MRRRLLKKLLSKTRYELWIGNTFEGYFKSPKQANLHMRDMYGCNVGEFCEDMVVDTWSPFSYVAQFNPGLHLFYWKVAGRKRRSPWYDWYYNPSSSKETVEHHAERQR